MRKDLLAADARGSNRPQSKFNSISSPLYFSPQEKKLQLITF
jgi:hypothetical protein